MKKITSMNAYRSDDNTFVLEQTIKEQYPILPLSGIATDVEFVTDKLNRKRVKFTLEDVVYIEINNDIARTDGDTTHVYDMSLVKLVKPKPLRTSKMVKNKETSHEINKTIV